MLLIPAEKVPEVLTKIGLPPGFRGLIVLTVLPKGKVLGQCANCLEGQVIRWPVKIKDYHTGKITTIYRQGCEKCGHPMNFNPNADAILREGGFLCPHCDAILPFYEISACPACGGEIPKAAHQ